MGKRKDSMEWMLKLILNKLGQTDYRTNPTKFKSDEIQKDKGKSRDNPLRVEKSILDAKFLPLGEGKDLSEDNTRKSNGRLELTAHLRNSYPLTPG